LNSEELAAFLHFARASEIVSSFFSSSFSSSLGSSSFFSSVVFSSTVSPSTFVSTSPSGVASTSTVSPEGVSVSIFTTAPAASARAFAFSSNCSTLLSTYSEGEKG
jgi:hypothetical protein